MPPRATSASRIWESSATSSLTPSSTTSEGKNRSLAFWYGSDHEEVDDDRQDHEGDQRGEEVADGESARLPAADVGVAPEDLGDDRQQQVG